MGVLHDTPPEFGDGKAVERASDIDEDGSDSLEINVMVDLTPGDFKQLWRLLDERR